MASALADRSLQAVEYMAFSIQLSDGSTALFICLVA